MLLRETEEMCFAISNRRMFPTKVQGYEIRRWRKHAPSVRLFGVNACNNLSLIEPARHTQCQKNPDCCSSLIAKVKSPHLNTRTLRERSFAAVSPLRKKLGQRQKGLVTVASGGKGEQLRSSASAKAGV